ncbi:MAG: hypothetical protein WDM94_15495 [Bauldia sp.]
MLTAIPLTIVPLILFNVIGYAVGVAPGAESIWLKDLFSVPLISGETWPVTPSDLMILLGLIMLFFETLRSALPARTATIANHIISTILLIVYVVEFIVVPVAGDSLFFILTAIALFDVVAGFTISIRTAQRDISFGAGVDQGVHH